MKDHIKNHKIKVTAVLLSLFFILVLYIHNVSKKITKEDITYIHLMIPSTILDKSINTFEEETNFILSIQNALHDSFDLSKPIDFKQEREPKNLYLNKKGQCYDYSRTIEKALILKGFETRHVGIYIKNEQQKWHSIFTDKKILSHSLLEVKTTKGWMIVDSNFPFLGIDSNNNPISFKQIEYKNNIKWKMEIPKGYDHFYLKPVRPIYGLYSRHGNFYPPYDYIPDYNLSELFFNFTVH